MNIKRIGAKLPKLNIRLEKRKKKKTGKKACYASNLCKKIIIKKMDKPV